MHTLEKYDKTSKNLVGTKGQKKLLYSLSS